MSWIIPWQKFEAVQWDTLVRNSNSAVADPPGALRHLPCAHLWFLNHTYSRQFQISSDSTYFGSILTQAGTRALSPLWSRVFFNSKKASSAPEQAHPEGSGGGYAPRGNLQPARDCSQMLLPQILGQTTLEYLVLAFQEVLTKCTQTTHGRELFPYVILLLPHSHPLEWPLIHIYYLHPSSSQSQL